MPSSFAWRRRLKLLQAKVVLGVIAPHELCDSAMEALHDNCGGDALVQLATLEAPYSIPGEDAIALFRHVAVEQKLPPMNARNAFLRFAAHTCRLLVAGEISTDECAFEIFDARLKINETGDVRNIASHRCGDAEGIAFFSYMDRSDYSYEPAEFDRRAIEIAIRWANSGPLGPRERPTALGLDGDYSEA